MTEAAWPIRPFDVRGASDEEYRVLNDFSNRLHAEILPEDPPTPLEERIVRARHIPPFVCVSSWAAWNAQGTAMIGRGSVHYLETEENKHLVQFHISVLPEYRCRGLGTRLLAHVVEAPRRENRRLMITGTTARVAGGEAFMARLGAQRGLEAHTNQLALADLDRRLLQQWLARAAERAAGFEIGFWDGAYPEDQITPFAQLLEVMNTAPRDGLDVEDFRETPERLREHEKGMLAGGTERWTLYVRETATSHFAGFTDVYWHPNRPQMVHQGGTGVRPEYRNKGLGRWLKAAMLDKILRERPQVTCVRTGNADSNGPMLRINQELGFKPHLSETVWQVETDKVVDYLNRRG